MGGSKRKTQQQQTRLAFTPLPSSSPAAASYNKQIRDRAATVGIEASPSPSKRRKVRDAPGASPLRSVVVGRYAAPSLLPTPDPTGTMETISEADGDAPSRPAQRLSSRKSQKRQKKLQFDSSPLPVSSASKSLNMAPPIGLRSTRSSKPTPKAGFFGTQNTITVDSSDEDEDASLAQLPSLTPSRSKRKRSLSHEDEPEPVSKLPDKTVALDEAEEQNEDEDDDDEVIPTTPAARRRARLPLRTQEDDAPERGSSPFVAEEDDEGEDSDDVVIMSSRTRGKRKAVSSDEDSPAEQAPQSRKRLRARLNPISEEEAQDLEDDLRDLASSGSDTEVRPSQKKKRNARQEALARLKRKREGAVEISDDDDGDEEEDPYIYEDDEQYGREEEEGLAAISNDEEPEQTIMPARMTPRDMFHPDEEDDSFVIADEDDGALGVPGNIPIEFTRYASMKAKDLFRYAIDWMVQKKINPAFQIDDEIYDLAFKKLDDEVKGLAGSKFTSSAWTSEFTCTLEARPELEFGRIDRASAAHFLRDKCDACNRSGHPATYEVRLQGRPYHHITLEPVARSNDSDSDDLDTSDSEPEEEGASEVDAKGRRIASVDHVFYLGKFCMSNAQTAHSLHHWRYHLFEWVVDYLNQAGYNAPAKIVKRDGWSTRKRRKYANKIVDAMQTDGKIKALYRDFKGELETARNSKQGRFGGDSP